MTNFQLLVVYFFLVISIMLTVAVVTIGIFLIGTWKKETGVDTELDEKLDFKFN